MPRTPPPLVIIDTNVLVAGLLTAREDSPVACILDGLLAARFRFVISDALLTEYQEVLLRPRLARHHGLTAAQIEAVVAGVALHAIRLTPTKGPPAPDRGGQHLWDLLATRPELHLVTGDRRLLDDAAMTGRVLSPADFVGLMHEGR